MKTSVNEATAKNCPTCSRPLPSGAPAGLCPACLLAQGAETESGAGGPRNRFVPPPLAEIAVLFPQLEILRLLGAGGMGAVYQARQPALDRFVALKVLPAGGDGANFEERFNREARALARLSHPNIVAVHEFGQAGALHYFLMEYVDGANLRQLEQASRLSAREALQLIPQICDALQYAHDEGVVHRDIKPENVLVDRKGRVKIADFGLAKILGHDPEAARLTVEGQVMGTPHYMAPEQVERPLAVDHRADIYSLGVVFYEMLTGDLPLGKFAPPSRKVQVDVRLDEIVLRALENDPARRYQQASEVKSGVATVVETPAAARISKPATDDAGESAPKPGVRYLRWLGIPAVVERDGEREVNFQGALGVFFVMLMTSALTQQAVRWGTGTEYAMTQLGFVTAVLMAIWAIRRTMNQPWGDEPLRRAANGTVILSPSTRRRYVRDGFMVAGLIVFVVGSHFLKVRALNSWSVGNSGPKAAQVGLPNPTTGTSLIRHPGGGTAELLGISEPDSATNGWWRADGTVQDRFTLGVREVEEPSATNALLRNFVLQFNGLGRDTVERIEFEGALASSGHSGADEVVRDGKSMVTDARRYLVSFPAGMRTTTIRVAWGMADWQTTLSMAAPIWRESPQGGVSNSKWRLKFVGQPAMTGGELQVSYLCGRRDPRWSHRLVAIDQQGREHDSQGGTGTGTGGGPDQDMVFVMHFRGLDLADVKEFRLQSRPLQWVEFPNVALNPKVPLPRREALRLAEPIERTFDELIDFDTGRTTSFPVAVPAANPFTSIGENILWAQENGFDAVAGRGELQVADADFAPLSNADWDTLSAQEVINRLHRGTFHPRTLKELRPGEFPATYAYRTREQGYGVIQLVAFDPLRPGATVRLKRVVRPGENHHGSGARPPAAHPAAALELRPVVPAGDTTAPFELLTTAAGQPLRVAKTPWLRGDAFAGASWRMDPVSNTRVIVLHLSDSGRREFARLSAEHVREQVALVLAGRVLFAPQIAAPMDVATLELVGLDRDHGQFVELLAALNPRPAAAGSIRFGAEHEAVLLNSGGRKFHWWNLAEARAMTVAGTDRSTREYHEARGGAGGDLEALGDNPVPLVSGQDLMVVPLVGDGQSPTALEVAYRWELLHQEPEPENLLSTGTYALRTRRGFTGILEVLGWTQDQAGVRIRYREVVNSNAAPDLGSPPRLRILAWQAGTAPAGAAGTWRPDGTPVPLEDLAVMRRLSVGLVGLGRPESSGKEHYLHVCLSHPTFDRHSFLGLDLLDENGRATSSLGGNQATSFTKAERAQGADAWWAITLNPGAGDQVPKAVNLRLRYAVGPLVQVQSVPAKSWESAALNGWLLSGVGEEDRRRTYLALSGDDEQDQTSGVQAVMKDGRTVDAESVRISSSPSVRRRRFIFAAPLAEVLEFWVGRRAIRTVDWTNVVLLPGKPRALPMPREQGR